MQKVLVTGASGFIGRHLVDSLRSRGCEIWCLVRPTSKLDHLQTLQCRLLVSDVLQASDTASAIANVKPDTVFYLAGSTKAFRKQSFFDVNQGGARNFFGACAELETPPVAVFVSTLAAAGPARSGASVDAKLETDAPAPVSYYGRSKLAAEYEARSFADRVPISIVRPPIVFGPHDKDSLEMYRTIAAFRLHPVPSLRPMSVSWIQVEDVCEAMIATAERGERITSATKSDGVYFATSDEVVDYAQLGRLVAKSIEKRAWPVPAPRPFVWGLASISECFARVRGEQNILNFDKAREATAGSWTCSGEKLKQQTGFKCKWTLAKTLQASADWYRQAGWL